MSLKLEIQKKSLERSPRVKALDFHNENTWVVYGLYSGTLSLYDYNTNVFSIIILVLHPDHLSISISCKSSSICLAEAMDCVWI
jgi:WD40 repeat protein